MSFTSVLPLDPHHFGLFNNNGTVYDFSQQDNKDAYGKEFWIGIGVSFCTNLIQAFAMAFQRKSHILNDQLYPVELRKPSLRRPMWVAGFATYLAANIIGSVFSIGYLPIVILAPIGAMGLVFNALAARIVLGDPFSKRSIAGTLLIVIGALLVGLFGVIPEPDHDIDDLIRLYKRPAFIAYFSVLETFIVTTILLSHYAESIYYRIERSGFQHGGKWLGQWISPADFKMCIGISFGVIAGNISSQSMLFAKSGIELIILTVVFKLNQLQYALTWILLIMMVVTAILQLYYLNKGLRLCDTVILIPLSSCAFNVSCLFNGLVYYNQWSRLFWWQLLLVMLGVTITISGVLLLSWRSNSWGHHGPQVQEDTVVQQEYQHSSSSNPYYTTIPSDDDDDDEEEHDFCSSSVQSELRPTTPPTSSSPTEKTHLLRKK
ncbi:uncharacterized protein BX664DRAFT_325594 [Halteromyces radiatus]|uniref:uncharacterized protein n=1 Tax=Halteromyces radiatus TaxID=101107 RepID=UPI00221FFCB2|nr:uncharacterized protein BX664DRAFT_325594 [Halteromyces radiatus]KAI8097113.1 hypothetical protein BX664DRAFT_325594 [Halteromyces radiatus]